MLVLSRKKGESIMIGENIELSVIDIQGDQVRIGINAPREVSIFRKEVFEQIKSENLKAAEKLKGRPELLEEIKKFQIKDKD
ncbi:MAG: carbon storage regulator CsrA [Syntrophomonadaceae bacterium]|nr:carbon storage regulator CsrA [Syntrophomonadaceae bacterium]